MFNYIKNLFSNKFNYSMGVYLNPIDHRDVNLAAVQAPVKIPDTYKTDLSMFEPLNQLAHGSCVWQSLRILVQYYIYKATGKVVALSARSGYILSKQKDGIAEQGTIPRVAAGILKDIGIATNEKVPDDNTLPYDKYLGFTISQEVLTDMGKNKVPGYASVPIDQHSIQQAIYQNGVVVGTLAVDTNWFSGIIQRVFNILGYHYTVWYGYDTEGFFARNSWGSGWVAVLAKVMGFPAGDFYWKWSDYNNMCYDVFAFTAIPKPILEDVKKQNYYFSKPMKLGEQNYDIMKLQERMISEGCWLPSSQKPTGYYGEVTRMAVARYQIIKGIVGDGTIVGPQTMRALNGTTKMKLLDAQIQIESRGNDYAIGDVNIPASKGGPAYGCLQIRQGVVDDVNKKLGTRYKSKDCLGNRALSIKIWETYWTVYPDMKTDEEKAKCWNGGPGWKSRVGKPEYQAYNNAINSYWNKVKSLMI